MSQLFFPSSYGNNKFPTCPALMEDGKVFTDYRAHKLGDLALAKEYKLGDSQSYRQFLQINGDKLIRNNKKAMEVYFCSPRLDRKYDPLNVQNFKGYETGSTSTKNAGKW